MSHVSSVADSHRAARSDHRWLVLVIVAVAQLMVVLDATVVNIALPSAQHALGFPYALAFGSLLLLGGRLGDMFSRKRVFIAGLAGFALSSALGGAAVSFGMLVAARTLQGAFGAILAPAALGTLVSTFRDPRERGRAFGVFGSVAGGGGAVGLILGGVLTQYFSWRWTLYVNLLFAAIAIAGALAYMRSNRPERRPRMDWAGTVLASAGLFLIVFGSSWRLPSAPLGVQVARVWSNEAAARAYAPRPHLLYGTSTRRPRTAAARRGLLSRGMHAGVLVRRSTLARSRCLTQGAPGSRRVRHRRWPARSATTAATRVRQRPPAPPQAPHPCGSNTHQYRESHVVRHRRFHPGCRRRPRLRIG
jgi:MFS family permease